MLAQLIIPFTGQTSGKLMKGNIEGGTAQKIDQLLTINSLKLLFVYLGNQTVTSWFVVQCVCINNENDIAFLHWFCKYPFLNVLEATFETTARP